MMTYEEAEEWWLQYSENTGIDSWYVGGYVVACEPQLRLTPRTAKAYLDSLTDHPSEEKDMWYMGFMDGLGDRNG